MEAILLGRKHPGAGQEHSGRFLLGHDHDSFRRQHLDSIPEHIPGKIFPTQKLPMEPPRARII
jgi:hypothetical protein